MHRTIKAIKRTGNATRKVWLNILSNLLPRDYAIVPTIVPTIGSAINTHSNVEQYPLQFEDLPKELIILIFSFIPLYDLGFMSFTCKDIHSILRYEYIDRWWISKSLYEQDKSEYCKQMKKWLNECEKITTELEKTADEKEAEKSLIVIDMLNYLTEKAHTLLLHANFRDTMVNKINEFKTETKYINVNTIKPETWRFMVMLTGSGF